MSDPQIPTPAPYRRPGPPASSHHKLADTSMADTEMMIRQNLAPETAGVVAQQWVSCWIPLSLPPSPPF